MHGQLVHEVDHFSANCISLQRGEPEESVHDRVGSRKVLQFVGLQVYLSQMEQMIAQGQFVGTQYFVTACATSLTFFLRPSERILGITSAWVSPLVS
jgi:hypothetical protein